MAEATLISNLAPPPLYRPGHLHLTDFNVAIRVKPDKMLTAAAGTRAYMAPEILRQKLEPRETRTGYFTTVDWWSLGIVMYESLFGKVRPSLFPSSLFFIRVS